MKTSLDYVITPDGRVLVSNNSGPLGHVSKDGFDDPLRAWCDSFPHDACEAFYSGITDDAATLRRGRDRWGVGDRADSPAFSRTVVNGRVVDLISGEHPHSLSDNSHYARFKGRDSGGRILGFNGHRLRWGVSIEEFNYTKESEMTGDEVRKGCRAVISIDGVAVYEFGGRELLEVAALVPSKIADLGALAVDLRDLESMIGRKVFYSRTPAVITHAFVGRVALAPHDGGVFPPEPWEDSDADRSSVTDDVLSPRIWWHRD